MTEDLEIHIIELEKMRRKLEDGSLKKWISFLENPKGVEIKEMEEDKIEKWLLFFEDPTGEGIRKIAEEEPEIKEAIERLEDISSDEEKIRIAELREKYIMDRESELETAEEKGIKKGLKEGLKEGIKQGKQEGLKEGSQIRNKEIAKKMKSKKMPIEDIIEITGLTKEEIEKI